MSPSGFALVLTAAILHATWNFCVKRVNAGPELIWLFSVFSVLFYLPLAVWILATSGLPDFRQFVFICGSAALHMGYFLLLQLGYRNGDLSLVYPTARATGPLLATILAVGLLAENITTQGVLGGLTIILGVLMLTGGFGRARAAMMASLGFGLAAGLFIGSYTVWDAYSVSALLIPPLLLDYGSNLARAVFLTPVALRRRAAVDRIWKDHRIDVLMIAIFSPLAYILVLHALTFTPVIYVAPLRELSVVLTVLMGSILLGEGHLRHRLLWACIILTGVSILVTAG